MSSWRRWIAPPALVLVAPGWAAAERYMTIEEAQASLFPGERLTPEEVKLTPAQVKAIEDAARVRVRVPAFRVWRAPHGGVFIVDEVLGKHDFITWALAIDADGSVRGLEILEYRETYGSEIRNERWRAQFKGKRAGAPLKLDGDIRNISGATLSSRHVADGVRRLLHTYAVALER